MVAGRRKYLSGLLVRAGPLRGPPSSHRAGAVRPAPAGAHAPPLPAQGQDGRPGLPGRRQGVAVLGLGRFAAVVAGFELPARRRGGGGRFDGQASIQILGRYRGRRRAPPDAVMIHGRPDLADALRPEAFTDVAGRPHQRFPDPGYDGRFDRAGAGARVARRRRGLRPDARRSKPRPSIWQIFPGRRRRHPGRRCWSASPCSSTRSTRTL